MTRSYRVTALPGEGIGPEVTRAALTILHEAAPAFDVALDVQFADLGRPALEKTGNAFPEETARACADCDGILLGGIEREGLLELRSHFDFFACLRPVQAFECLLDNSSIRPEKLRGADVLTVRELTSGLAFGAAGRGDDARGAYGFHTMTYHDYQLRRIARVALEQARRRRGRLTVAHKENALPQIPWRRLVSEEAEAFPDVTVDSLHADDLSTQLVNEPRRFDVIVAGNLMGDWISSLAAALVGSVGMCPSACLDEKGFGVYEGIHGTAPDIAGQGIANPIGTLDSAVLMLRQWGEDEMAAAVLAARLRVLERGYRTPDLHPETAERSVTTDRMVELIVGELGGG